MTPLHMEILIHHHCTPCPFPRSSPGIESYRGALIQDGLLMHSERIDGQYELTAKGEAWLKRALNTPMPTLKWVWESDEETIK